MSAKHAGAHNTVRLRYLLVAPIIIFVAVFLVAKCATSVLGGPSSEGNRFTDRAPYVSTNTAASRAADAASGRDQAILRRLAGVPTAVWLTPEAYPVDTVDEVVASTSRKAAAAERTPVFVVYGITNRDCSGGESSGGLSPDDYRGWVSAIASSAGAHSVAILEPDALATAAECSEVEQRTGLLHDAVGTLTDAGLSVYVDAGHAQWTPPAEMSEMLKAVGVDRARGFSTNVAGYESNDDELAYAEAIRADLPETHYVIDTSRNGLGSNGEWCNPSGRALGAEPLAQSGGGLDAYVWIKPPGESDGECGGGPRAGEFWVERAVELATNAGW